MARFQDGCKTCDSNRGDERISPAKPLYQNKLWRVEHAYPTGLQGWLVVMPERHVEAVHNLTTEENRAFSTLLPAVARALHTVLDVEKEYVVQYAEIEGFQHVHYHVIGVPKDLGKEFRGGGIFQLKNNLKPLDERIVVDVSRDLATAILESMS